MKERPILFSGPMVKAIIEGRKSMTRRVAKENFWSEANQEAVTFYCPYGQPGDRLWVRETWHCDNPAAAQDIMNPGLGCYYLATEEHPEIFTKWKPSIFMPRWASRITLEIVSLKVERLQEITDEDAIKEGQPFSSANSPRIWFMTLWDSINGKKYPWTSNPWIWVIEFKNIGG